MNLAYSCLSFSELSTAQLYELMVLRQVVFVVEQDCPYLDADGQDQQAYHVLGYREDQNLVAYARLLPKGTAYPAYVAIGRVVIHPEVRGLGMGKTLMLNALTWIAQLWPGEPVKISAQAHLEAFYRTIGFQPTGEAYLEDNIPHIGMVKV